jgi:hypothetical protein
MNNKRRKVNRRKGLATRVNEILQFPVNAVADKNRALCKI